MAQTNSALMGQLLNQLLTESRITNTAICSVYDPKESINNWLAQFDLNAQRLGLDDQQKLIHIGRYLPMEISNWIARSATVTTWSILKTTLIKTYGIPAAKYKQIIRRRLESLNQGNLSSRRFAVLFESVIFEFPVDDSLDANTLRSIYLRVMAPKVRAMILPNIATKLNWKAVSQAAVEIEECLSMNEDFLELNLWNWMRFNIDNNHMAVLTLRITIVNHLNNPVTTSLKILCVFGLPLVLPICGLCGKEGHLTKKCYSRKDKRKHVHAISSQPVEPTPSPVTVNYVNAIAKQDYAIIPLENDPLFTPGINSISISASESSTPRVKVSLGTNQTVSALIDTGASLTVLLSAVARQLGLTPDPTQRVSFTTSNNQANLSPGQVQVSAVIGELPIKLNWHTI
ncbi:hypothetical protein BD770DRAFT_456602 [Pilaira anomala]|nr:hypothetical protein BD770DRAFT_456602 [Pilaira anomala]